RTDRRRRRRVHHRRPRRLVALLRHQRTFKLRRRCNARDRVRPARETGRLSREGGYAMRYGYWLPVFGGWLRNVEDEGMEASWNCGEFSCRRVNHRGHRGCREELN